MKRLLCFLCIVMPFVSYGQYSLYVNEYKFLELPDPPMDGYIENAWWDCNKPEICFDETSEVGAIIYPKHYFDGTAIVSCSYYFSYLGYDGYMHASQGSYTFYITCKAVITTLQDSYVEISPGSQYTISYSRGTSSFGYPTMEWSSNDKNVATVNSNGTVTAVSLGSARITCDPINGPIVFCDIKVCENPAGDDNNGADNDGDSGNTDSSADNKYEKSIHRIDNLKRRVKDYLHK